MKSLKTIQVLAKIGKIASKVVFIVSIVCLCFLALGVLAAIFLPGSFKAGSVNFLLYDAEDMSMPQFFTSSICGMVLLAMEIVLSHKAEKYFTDELREGQPFTKALSNELWDLGRLTVILSFAVVLVINIGVAIVKHYHPEIDEGVSELAISSFGLGVAFLIVSLICRYGASVKDCGEAGENA